MRASMNIKSIIMVILIVCLTSMFFINISFATNTGKIVVETAILREEPNVDSKVLELASEGEEVEVLEELENWYKVKYKKITGYMSSELIKVENNIETNTNNMETDNAETNTNSIETDNTETDNTEIVENTVPENEIIETSTISLEEENVKEEIVEKGKYKIAENIKLKIIPLISAIELEEINKDAEVEVIEILNDWVKIRTLDDNEGWIRKDKLVQIDEIAENKQEQTNQNQTSDSVENNVKDEDKAANTTKVMYVNSQVINLRQNADKTSQVIKQLSLNAQVTVLSTENGWAYVDVDGIKGYIAENLLATTKQETSRSSMSTRSTVSEGSSTTQVVENISQVKDTSASNVASGTGSAVVSYAKQFLGCKYVYGGTSTNGFDCSGFTQYVYKNFGVNLSRTAAAQYSNGTSVTDLQAGDLVMFGKSGINHVGIYIGGNTFIHAANTSRGVTTDTLSSGYYKTNYVGARRVI